MRNSFQNLGSAMTHSVGGLKSKTFGKGIAPINPLSPQGGIEPKMTEDEEDYYEEEDDGTTPGPGAYFNP